MHVNLTTPILDELLGTAGPNQPLSVADAVRLVASRTDLSSKRRRDLTSILLTSARLAELPPGDLELTPEVLRRRVLDRSATAYGISMSRMRNVLSGLRYVLRCEGVIDDPANMPLTAAWQVLLAGLKMCHRAGLIGFARFCSMRGVAPDAVSAETLDAFEAWLTTRTLTPRPRKLAGQVRGSWNRACVRVEGWPARPLGHRPRLGRYALPLTAFPESFQRDLTVFGDRLTATVLDAPFPDEPEDENEDETARPRCPKPLRASTAALRQSHCRWAASALVATGVPIAEITTLASLVTPVSRVRDILRFLYERAGKKPSAAGTHVADVLRMVAKYYVPLGEKKVEQVQRWGAPVRLTYEGMTEKNELAIHKMMEPSRLALLLELPETLMRAARHLLRTSPKQAASLAMRGVAIGLLSKNPLRLDNVIHLRMDQHLQRPDLRRKRISYISIPADKTKNKRDILMPVSVQTARLLQEWITRFRPITASPGCPYLFPGHGTGHRPITPQALRDAIKSALGQHVGVALSPHQFRHLAARLFLDVYPGHYEEVRQLLRHSSAETTKRSYCSTESEAAVRRYDEVVLNQGKAVRPKTPRKGRR